MFDKNTLYQKFHIKRWNLVFIDALLLAVSLLAAFFLKYDFSLSQETIDLFLHIVPVIVVIQIIFFIGFKIYRSIWKYSGPSDLLLITQATTVNIFLLILAGVFLQTYLVSPRLISLLHFYIDPIFNFIFIGYTVNQIQIPFSILIIFWLLSTLFIGGGRLLARMWVEMRRKEQSSHLKHLLVVGGGNESEALIRELQRNPDLPYTPVGIVEENTNRMGFRIHGIKILGNIDSIPQIVKQHSIDEILITLPKYSGKIVRRIIALCEHQKVKIRTLPSVEDLFKGNIQLNQLPEIKPEDLLGREQVPIHTQEIAAYLFDQTVLITGAGGSIGSELCRQVAPFNPKILILLGAGENSIYEIEIELRHRFPNLTVVPVICNIQDKKRVKEVFSEYRPDVVFHAAAHKHVPMMELNPGEAVKNNILGTFNIAQGSDQIGSKTFILISTDKAIRPNSVMGITKRIAELVVECTAQNSKTKFAIVRFGNVLGSRGSVVPLFQKQIFWGGPITITHPDVTRYFMSIPEAVKLVIQTGSMADKGEIFALNMGEPIKITELARNLISLSGLDPQEDIQIQFSGLRPGEKLTEESVSIGKGIEQTPYPNIVKIPPDHVNHNKLLKYLDELESLTQQTKSSQDTFMKLKNILDEVLKES